MSLWLQWMQQIQAISQTGIHYSNTPYDKERYEKLLEIAIEIGSEYGKVPAETLREIHLRQTGYATPRVDVRAACFHDGKILLVRERADGRWALPGGWADVGDKPSLSAEREVWEESGYTCKAERLIGVFDGNRTVGDLSLFHAYKVVFLCRLTGEHQDIDSPEIIEYGFFDREEIPPLSLSRSWPELVEECFVQNENKNRPSVFD